MKKKYFFITIPIAILAFLYFNTKKHTIQGDFKRSFIYKKVPVIDTIEFSNKQEIDGICLDNNVLWINNRNAITKYNGVDGKSKVINARYKDDSKPIINFYVQNDSLYYFQANTKTINVINTKDLNQRSLAVTFPVTYFIKLKNNTFIFLESVIGKASMQVHYKDYDNNQETVNQDLFSKEIGSGMKYSGSWTYSQGKNTVFFVPFYDDNILCFNANGSFNYQFKPIDFQNQDLNIIKENSLFYLSPDANFIRPSSFSSKASLFISSYVRSKNQSKNQFKKNSTIDVYDNANGKYKYSFYIPKFSGQTAMDFALDDNKILYASYGFNVVQYNLSEILKDEN